MSPRAAVPPSPLACVGPLCEHSASGPFRCRRTCVWLLGLDCDTFCRHERPCRCHLTHACTPFSGAETEERNRGVKAYKQSTPPSAQLPSSPQSD